MTDLTREGLVELAGLVEQAVGPSRALDGAITKALGEYPCWAPNQNERQPELFTDGKPGTRAREWLCPEFTASLDAAITLVPDGWFTFLASEDRHSHRWRWEVRGHYGFQHGALASTAALALCAAALKARARAMEAGRG